MRHACATIVCVFLLNALLAVPFLVECIALDGRCIIERLGQDPCHEAVAQPPDDQTPYFGADLDPCLDLLLDTPEAVRILLRGLPSPPQPTGETADFWDAVRVLPGRSLSSCPCRDLRPPTADPGCPLSLRI